MPLKVETLGASILFDGVTVRRDVVLNIGTDGRVSSIQPIGNVKPEQDAKFVMPGMIDSHVHANGYSEGMPLGDPHKSSKDFLRLCLASGVTTVRDLGNSLDTIQYLKEWLESNKGPRLYASGPVLDGAPPTWNFTRIVSDKRAADLALERLALESVDWVKIYRSMEKSVLKSVVDQAHTRGLKVAFHSGKVSAYDGINLGVDSIEHAMNLVPPLDTTSNASDVESSKNLILRHFLAWEEVDPREIADRFGEIMRKNNTVLCPTLLVSRRYVFWREMVQSPNLRWMVLVMPYHKYMLRMQSKIGMFMGKAYLKDYLPILVDVSRETEVKLEHGYNNIREVVRLLHDGGVGIITGTDSPNPSLTPGYSLQEEILELNKCGISPLDCLKSVTSVPAQAIDSNLGVIKPGSYADILMLDGNPLDNLSDISRIRGVICRGDTVDTEKLAIRLKGKLNRALSTGVGA